MLDKLKADFDEILELVKKTPQPLQEIAFKMILERWFAANVSSLTSAGTPVEIPSPDASAATGAPATVKPFLTSNGITTETIGKVSAHHSREQHPDEGGSESGNHNPQAERVH